MSGSGRLRVLSPGLWLSQQSLSLRVLGEREVIQRHATARLRTDDIGKAEFHSLVAVGDLRQRAPGAMNSVSEAVSLWHR